MNSPPQPAALRSYWDRVEARKPAPAAPSRYKARRARHKATYVPTGRGRGAPPITEADKDEMAQMVLKLVQAVHDDVLGVTPDVTVP